MDLNPKMMQPLPFYMTHPGYLGLGRNSTVLQDMEYLQQMYPDQIKRYQRRVAKLLDKLDYEGSMIYDEYPDRCSLLRLSRTMTEILQKEAREAEAAEPFSREREQWLEDLVQVLLCNEIYKRRHGGRRGFFAF